jgi:hypothetical protein
MSLTTIVLLLSVLGLKRRGSPGSNVAMIEWVPGVEIDTVRLAVPAPERVTGEVANSVAPSRKCTTPTGVLPGVVVFATVTLIVKLFPTHTGFGLMEVIVVVVLSCALTFIADIVSTVIAKKQTHLIKKRFVHVAVCTATLGRNVFIACLKVSFMGNNPDFINRVSCKFFTEPNPVSSIVSIVRRREFLSKKISSFLDSELKTVLINLMDISDSPLLPVYLAACLLCTQQCACRKNKSRLATFFLVVTGKSIRMNQQEMETGLQG